MNTIQLVVLILELINKIVGYYQQKGWMQAGEDAAVAKASAAILSKTQTAKRIIGEINAIEEPEVDELLRRIERERVSNDKSG